MIIINSSLLIFIYSEYLNLKDGDDSAYLLPSEDEDDESSISSSEVESDEESISVGSQHSIQDIEDNDNEEEEENMKEMEVATNCPPVTTSTSSALPLYEGAVNQSNNKNLHTVIF